MPASRAFTLFPLFFLSGASALVFENLWQRKMMHVFGASAPSTIVILTAFFLGMAFGSWGGGRLLTRFHGRISTLRFYALTEVWIGVFGISVPLLLRVVDALYRSVFGALDPDPFISVVYRFAMCIAVALPASLGMGATIPVMSRLLADHGFGVGRSVGLAYGVNTLGAVLGCMATGFVLLPSLGIQGSLFFASALNAAVVLGSFLLSAGAASSAGPPPLASPAVALPRRRRLIALYVAAGFLAIGLEVTWMRMIAVFTSNALGTFTLSLSIYLIGFSLGSLILYPLLEKRLRGLSIFLVSNLGIAFSCLLLLPNAQAIANFVWSTPAEWLEGFATHFVWATSLELSIAASLMFVPTLFMGLAFPAICQVMTERRDRIALDSGFLYFAGNIGSTLGAFVTGLLLIPWLGIDATWGFLIALAVSLGIATLGLTDFPARRSLQLACAALLLPVVYLGSSDRPYVHTGNLIREGRNWRFVDDAGKKLPETIIRNETGASATVSVHEMTDPSGRVDRSIYVDDQPVAGTEPYSKVDSKMLAHVPFLLHPDPKSALTVGFGSGGTSWSMTTHGVQTDAVEIEREVLRSAPLFEAQNYGVMNSPDFSVILNDARNYLYLTHKSYDVISTDVTNLEYKQNGSLYTREFFQLVKDRLKPGGIACAWIPLFMADRDFNTLLATFKSVFPHSTLWYFDQMKTTFAILIGTPEALRFDYERIARGFERKEVREDLAEIGVYHPFHLVNFLYLDERGYEEFSDAGLLHTDDYPVLEFESHVTFHGAQRAATRDRMFRFLKLKPKNLESSFDHLPPAEVAELERYERFSDAWGAFTIYELVDPSRKGVRADLQEGRLHLLERAAEEIPEYKPARRALREYRKRYFDGNGGSVTPTPKTSR